MKRRNRRLHRSGGFAALLALTLLFACMVQPVMAEDDSEEKTLVITVLEDIPAEDIDDAEVPLAAFPAAEDHSTRHIALMGLTLLAVIAYAIYFGVYDTKLMRLRQEAAAAEHRAVLRFRAANRTAGPETGARS